MKQSFIILWLLSCTIYLCGQDVSEGLAVKMANDYYQRVKAGKTETTSIEEIANDKRVPERISPLGKANMWLVPVEDGWILLSGSMKAYPILAHFQSYNKPTYESFPPAAKELIDAYEENIAYISEHESEFEVNPKWQEIASAEVNASRNVSATMTEVLLPLYVYWGQINDVATSCDRYYNKYCPTITVPNEQCDKAAVGCVAVAVAQIMRYWKWPYAAQVPTTVGGSVTDMKFYDWSKMPSLIDNSTPMDKVNMITGFLRDCGYSLDMDYGIQSTAHDADALNTLVAFGYDANTMQLRDKWNTSGWTNLLRSNIDNGQPVYYSGSSTPTGGNGHAFIVDGYRTGDGPMYHINWGAYGNPDGWYNIDSAFINTTYHYEYMQSAIFGIRPAPVCTDLTINGSLPSLPSKFCVAVGGVLTVSNRTLQNIVQGELYSSSQVRLTTGVTIKQGSNVHIAIKDIPCSSATSNTPALQNAPVKDYSIVGSEWGTNDTFFVSPNPVNDILTITSSEELAQIRIYNLNGQCVLQTEELKINVSHLPSGVYMLRAVTLEGKPLQSKFIKR